MPRKSTLYIRPYSSVGVCVFIYIVIHNSNCNQTNKGVIMNNNSNKKQYYVVNRLSGAVTVIMSSNRVRAMRKGRRHFGNVALDLYAC